MNLDMNGIVKLVYPDGSDSGTQFTVRGLINIIRRAKIGYCVELFAAPTLIGIAVGVIWANKDEIKVLFRRKKYDLSNK